MALHIYARGEGFEYIDNLIKSICERGDAWAHEGNNPSILGLAGAVYKLEKEESTLKMNKQQLHETE